MRSLHALFVIGGLAALLVAGLFLFRGQPEVASVALDGREPASASAAQSPAAALHTPEAMSKAARETAPVAAAATPAAAKTTAAERPQHGLSGRVVDARGRALAEAVVYAARANGLEGIPLDNLDPKDMPWSKRIEGITDAQGRFLIHPEAAGELRLGARKAGFAPRDTTTTVAGTRDIGDLVMEDSAVLEGRVVDAAGRPVEGASLRRLDPAGSTGFAVLGGTRGVKVATTDDRGSFRVDQLASGPWKLLITSEAHPDKIESGETERPGKVLAGLEFVLEEGTEIQGRVVRAPAEALEDLWVRAVPKRTRGEGSDGAMIELTDFGAEIGSAPRRAKCASDGSFTVRGLKADQAYRVAARDSEREFLGRTRTGWVDARAGDRGVQLAYRPETAIVFRAIDAKTGEPVTELDVRAGYRFVMPLVGESGRVQRTFPDGRVRFGNLPDRRESEQAKLDLEARGYREVHFTDLDPVDGQDLDLGILRLERAPVVVVTVLDQASGAPVEGALVTLTPEEPESDVHSMSFTIGDEEPDDSPMQSHTRRARTDRDGKARLNAVADALARFTVRHGSYAPFRSALLEASSDDREETVRLRIGGSVTVELVDSRGAPVAGTSIRHLAPGDKEERYSIGGDDGGGETDAEGRAVFAHLEEGVHRFRADSAADGPFVMGENVVVRTRRQGGPGAAADPGWSDVAVTERGEHSLRLVAPSQSRLTGRVTEGGKPLAGATVALADEGDEAPMLPFMSGGLKGRTNGDGEYSIEKVKVGSYTLTVTHPSRAMAHETSVRIREDENERDVELAIAVIEGRILDEHDKPVPGVRVHAERAREEGAPRREMRAIMVMDDGGDSPAVSISSGDSPQQVFSDADGRYALRGVVSDVDLVVKATAKDFQPGQSEVVRVAADQTKSRVDMKVARGAALEVRVVRADGRPGSECLVHARPDEGEPSEPKIELTGSKGAARFDGLKPGKWRIRVDPIGMGNAGQGPEQVVEVRMSEANTTTIEVP